MKNKIALVNNWHPFSGGGKYAFNILSRLKDANMLYFEYGSNKIENMKNVIKIKSTSFEFMDKTIGTYYWFPHHLPDGFDLYHATNQYLAEVAKKKKPTVITHMDLIPVLFPKGKFIPIGFFLKRLIKNYKYAEHIICLSEVVKNELLQFIDIPDEKLSVISPGFDEKIYKPMDKEKARKKLHLPLDKKIILNVGSTEPDKGVPLLLNILTEINSKKRLKMLFVRIGSGHVAYDSRYFDTLEVKGIAEEQMPLYYAAADVFAAPFNYGAGFVYPPLEAIACGTPALVSNLQFPGYVNVPHELFKDTLLNMLDDDKFRRSLAFKGLEASKAYTLSKEVTEINKVYKKVLE